MAGAVPLPAGDFAAHADIGEIFLDGRFSAREFRRRNIRHRLVRGGGAICRSSIGTDSPAREEGGCGCWWWVRVDASMLWPGDPASPLVDSLFCAPGNAGIADVADCVPIGATISRPGRVLPARADRFRVVGPEISARPGSGRRASKPRHRGFRPERRGGPLEGSKAFAKDLCGRAHPDRRLSPLPRPAAAKAFIRAASPDRRQGRWACRRQRCDCRG